MVKVHTSNYRNIRNQTKESTIILVGLDNKYFVCPADCICSARKLWHLATDKCGDVKTKFSQYDRELRKLSSYHEFLRWRQPPFL